ncbi:hypothetical protein [Cupriavidus sp. D39]|uniref:hypothetical protein n=1 Tax=Cupriavidus sp. D39 TaxID=2997877 RepID=UPI00226F6F4A|nr:hypothetical protein [Cupriavidus sp. D39]MCY0854603.1 hypothetical protein [Cupriavidus sp. D39]
MTEIDREPYYRQLETPLSWEMSQMQEFDFYINPKKPTLGLYVRKGAGLPDLADPDQWVLDGNVWQTEVPPEILNGLEANGHAFQELGA